MKVFTQLMMKKFHSAVNYMNLTVVGSPTINNGVVSGFSLSNYLQASKTFDMNKPFDIVMKVSPSKLAISPIITGNVNPALTLHLSNRKVCFQIGNGTAWESSLFEGDYAIPQNSFSYVRLKFENNIFTSFYSLDGQSWVVEDTWTNTVVTLSTITFNVGITRNLATYYFNGSIDLFNSYVISDGTKYIFTV